MYTIVDSRNMSSRPLDNDLRENTSESLSYESESGSEESSSSDDEVMVRPVFVSKTKRIKNKTQIDTATDTTDSSKAREIALERAENLGTIEVIEGANEAFDGVDDSDDVEPEKEYTEWRGRERKRYERDMALLREEEKAHEDKLRREDMSEEQLQKEFDQRRLLVKSPNGDGFRKGAFFNE